MQTIELERTLLSSLMVGESGDAAYKVVTEDDFLTEENKAIFAAMLKLRTEKKHVDLLTLEGVMPAQFGDILVKVAHYSPSSAMAPQYARAVKDAANIRRMVRIAESMIQQALEPGVEPDEIVSYARQQLRDVTSGKGTSVTIDKAMSDMYTSLEEASEKRDLVIKSGIEILDNAIAGFFPGELTILAARTSVGKSAMALRIGLNAARQGKNVYFVSLEMSTNQLCHRMIAGNRFDMAKLRKGEIEGDQWGELADEMGKYGGLPLRLDTTVRYIEDLCAEINARVDDGKCDLVIVDYVQKMQTREKHSADHLRVGSIVWKLKQLTLELGIPVIALAQVNRIAKNGESPAPMLENLKDSGAIEMDADNVILLHTPLSANDQTINKDDVASLDGWAKAGFRYLHVDVAKQRQGPTGRFHLLFNTKKMTYHQIKRGGV